ncbi:MAG: alginate lyase family protein [Gemmatimonadaceae bacterium]
MSVFTSLGRLRGRSRAELTERAAQFMAARAERWGLRDSREPSMAEVQRLLTGAAAGGRATLESWFSRVQAGDSPMFQGLADRTQTIAALRTFAPAAEGVILSRAERMLRGEFDLLGYCGVTYALPIDWHLDPVRNVHAPDRHWSEIPFLDSSACGDHKAIWEINRHQVLVTLGQAYWYSGDERFAQQALAWMDEWMDANPPKRGINYASSLEVAFRAISWLWVLQLLRQSPSFTLPRFARAIGHLTIAARHLDRYLSTYFSPNTHLTGEALGLFLIGSQLAPVADAARWRDRGRDILLEQLPRHVQPDGIYFEQATYYQRYTAEFYLHLFAHVGSDAATRETITPFLGALLESLESIMRPDGTIPLIGDDDGGRLMFLDGTGGDDIRGLLAAGGVALGRGDLAFGAAGGRADVVWLHGPRGVDAFGALSKAPPAQLSRAFMHGGILVMRDGWSSSASVMTIDCGPHGVYNCGHAHADALAFDLTVHGRPIFVDPGTYTYTAPLDERDRFRSTAVHNTLTVNGESSSRMNGPFSWTSIARSSIDRWHTSPRVDFFEGSHDGYERVGIHAEVVRTIVFVKDGYWIVRDRITGGRRYDAMATFQAAIGLDVVPQSSDVVAVVEAESRRERLRLHAPGADQSVEIDVAWVSPAYGVRSAAARVRVRKQATGPLALDTVLSESTLDARVTRRRGPSSDVVDVRHGTLHDVMIFADGGEHPETDGVSTDADACWIRRDSSTGQAVECFATGATHLTIDGTPVAALPVSGAIAARFENGRWIRRHVGASSTAAHRAVPGTSEPDESDVVYLQHLSSPQA